MKLTLARIAELVSAEGEFASEKVAQEYSIDSRTVGAGQLFFAVKGERLDGHDFVEQALDRGATAAVARKAQFGRYSVQKRMPAAGETPTPAQGLGTRGWRPLGKPPNWG